MSAASLAFHWFIALVPAAIAFVGVSGLAGLQPSRLHALTRGVSVLLPASTANVLERALQTQRTGGSNVLAIVAGGLVALWASLEAAVALEIGLDMAYETVGDRGFLRRRLRAFGLVGVTVLFGGAAFALLIVGGPLGSLIEPTHSAGWFPIPWTVFRWVSGIACVVVLVSLYDYLAPNRTERRWTLLSVGGSVSTALWLAVAAGYSFYLNHFGRTSATYGAFSGVVVLLLWLYLTGVVILLGAETNRELERTATSTVSAPPGRERRARRR
jgi:membrane protein